MTRLVIASAVAFETDPLVAMLDSKEFNVTRVLTGIGLTEASIVASQVRSLIAGRDVIFCCTGGVIGEFETVKLFRAASIRLAPHDIRNDKSYLLDSFDPELRIDGFNLNLPSCDVFGSLGVSKADEESFCPGNQLETLELYGVARAWIPLAKSFTAVVGSTNATGPMAHEQWLANFKVAAKLTAETLVPEIVRLGLKAN